MRVGVVVRSNFPVGRQIRTERIARAIEAGDDTAIVFARNTGDDPARGRVGDDSAPAQERLPYAVVRRFSWLSSTPLFGVVAAPIPVNPFWTLWLLLNFSRQDVDVAVAGDLRSGIPTAIAGKLLGITVVFDLREDYAGLARALPADSTLEKVVQNERLVGALERTTIELADAVWVVVEERRDKLVAQGVAPEKLTPISNTPIIRKEGEETPLVDGGSNGAASGFDSPGFTLVYVGVLNEFRGLDLLLDAIAELDRDTGEPVTLVVAGEGPHRDSLERRCRELDIEDRVTFLGWIDSERVPAFLASGDVGVIPHRVTPLTEYTIPNKLFDYMLAGLPVLARNITPIKRIVTEENCGRVLPPDASGADAAREIRALKRSDLAELGRNGRLAVERRYNWSNDAETVRTSLHALHAT